jgi:GNAT superfamily N-acetyltransferase
MNVSIVSGQQRPGDVERLLQALPMWFGIEESNRAYVEAARTLPTTAALLDERVVGICLVRRHNSVAAEIELIAVDPALHRHGIGRQLLDAVEADLRRQGVQLLQVKTFGPSGSSVEYERTRAFYAAVGFWPLEERMDIWGPDNPCLISVKPLG